MAAVIAGGERVVIVSLVGFGVDVRCVDVSAPDPRTPAMMHAAV